MPKTSLPLSNTIIVLRATQIEIIVGVSFTKIQLTASIHNFSPNGSDIIAGKDKHHHLQVFKRKRPFVAAIRVVSANLSLDATSDFKVQSVSTKPNKSRYPITR